MTNRALLPLILMVGSCGGGGGASSESSDQRTGPGLVFTATETSVPAGGATTLTWTATGADTCTASGAWSGNKPLSGTEATGAITAKTTYTLTCNAAGGEVVRMLGIDAISKISISWDAPTENTDNTALTDLASFRIYYGEASRDYSAMVDVADPRATSHDLSLSSGTYFIAITALDSANTESGYSNEISKTAP